MLIADRYRLRDAIGRGAMGEVWRAFDETLDRPVAVILILTRDADPTAASRFRLEAQTAGRRHKAEARQAGQARRQGQALTRAGALALLWRGAVLPDSDRLLTDSRRPGSPRLSAAGARTSVPTRTCCTSTAAVRAVQQSHSQPFGDVQPSGSPLWGPARERPEMTANGSVQSRKASAAQDGTRRRSRSAGYAVAK